MILNKKRTASIYVNENSFFGKLSAQAYKKSMKRIQEQIKRENIEFVFSAQLFNQISLKFFSLGQSSIPNPYFIIILKTNKISI